MTKSRQAICPAPIAVLLMGLVISVCAFGAEDRPLIRGAFIEFPPLAYTTDAGQVEGTFIRLAEQVADQAGYRIHWQELPIGRVYLYLESGDLDMWLGSSGVPDLKAHTLETDFLTGYIQLNAYHREDIAPVSGIDELQGKSLILIRGYTYWRLLDHLKEDPDTFVTIAPDHRSAIRMLAFERGDYLINFQSPMEDILKDSPFPGLDHSNLLRWPLTMVFSRQAPRTRQMVKDLNQAWQTMQDSGRISLNNRETAL